VSLQKIQDLRCRAANILALAPKTVESVSQRLFLELEADELEARRTKEVLERQRLMFECFQKTGQVTVVYPGGQRETLSSADIPRGSDDVQDLLNAWYAIRNLAHRSVP
jgi:hypothetical protein